MAKRQTRRSISVSGATYHRVKAYCESTGQSVSGYVEQLIGERMDEAGVPVPEVVPSYPRPKPVVYAEDIDSAHWTF
jgi:hypothetical protein